MLFIDRHNNSIRDRLSLYKSSNRWLSTGFGEEDDRDMEAYRRLKAKYQYNPVEDTFSTYLDELGI